MMSEVLNLSKPHFPYRSDATSDDPERVRGLVRGLAEIMPVKCVGQCEVMVGAQKQWQAEEGVWNGER